MIARSIAIAVALECRLPERRERERLDNAFVELLRLLPHLLHLDLNGCEVLEAPCRASGHVSRAERRPQLQRA